jgi:hypothetical protein
MPTFRDNPACQDELPPYDDDGGDDCEVGCVACYKARTRRLEALAAALAGLGFGGDAHARGVVVAAIAEIALDDVPEDDDAAADED